MHAFTGHHVVAELYGVPVNLLGDAARLEAILRETAMAAGATVIASVRANLEPGVSIALLLSESHVSIHTYPEHRAAFVDLFTCGDSCLPERGIELLVSMMEPERYESVSLTRGGPAA